MPNRCSIPGCKTGHKQGLSLLCYPKDPERRSAWLHTVRKRGLEPTNNHFICELHFGPDQWEKIRVDGTKKLKWSGVPNILDPEGIAEARERAKANSSKLVTESKPSFSPKILKKVFMLDKSCSSSSPTIQNSAKTEHLQPATKFCSTNVIKFETEKNPTQPVSKNTLRAPIKTPSPLLTVCSLPLSGPEHSIVVKVPRSRHETGLMEDLDDIKSFLNEAERTYEERLIKALSELVKKHQLLDERIQKAQDTYEGNVFLQQSFEEHKKVLLENYNLKEKLRKYEQRAIVKSAVIKERSNLKNGTTREVDRIEKVLPDDRCEEGAEVELDLSIVSEEEKATFVSLDDQL